MLLISPYVPGEEEAVSAGKALKDAGYQFDVAHTSVLTRAQKTLGAILTGIGQADLPVEKSWRLNERHYGGLTGLNKSETAAKYGEDQVWIRSITGKIAFSVFLINSRSE